MKSVLLAIFILTLITVHHSAHLKFEEENEVSYKNITAEFDVDVDNLMKDKSKLERKLKKLKHIVEDVEDTAESLKKENKEMKNEIQVKNKELENLKNSNSQKGGKAGAEDMKEVLSHMREFQTLSQQMDLQGQQEKELRSEINEKMKEISNSQSKVDEIYRDLKSSYKGKILSLQENVEKLKNNEETMKQRIYMLEKENEKVAKARKDLAIGKTYAKKAEKIEPECIKRNSCRTCLDDAKCVWCAKSNKCMLGDISGAYDGTCNSTEEFKFSSCENSSFCNSFKTCTECIGNLSCGWCSEMNMCVEGTHKNPIGLACSKGYFHQLAQGRCSSHSFLRDSVNSLTIS